MVPDERATHGQVAASLHVQALHVAHTGLLSTHRGCKEWSSRPQVGCLGERYGRSKRRAQRAKGQATGFQRARKQKAERMAVRKL